MIFDPYPPTIGSFVILSVNKFWKILTPPSPKKFRRLKWMVLIAKSPNHHCNWWKDPALSSQPLKSSESSRSRVKQAMEKPQPCALSNCPFLFLVGEFQKLASRNRKCIESVLRTHTYMRARTKPGRAAPWAKVTKNVKKPLGKKGRILIR